MQFLGPETDCAKMDMSLDIISETFFWLEINIFFRLIYQKMQNNSFDHFDTQILVVGGLRERKIQHSDQVCGVIDDVYM